MSVKIDLIGCADWGAELPRGGKEILELVPKSKRIIDHHTAGHHPEIEDPRTQSRAESIRYARDIQHFHMYDRYHMWLDSGHNFLICRNGLILQGRWLTIAAIRAGLMIRSAHCPGQNEQIGIEHEHNGTESMTAEQRESSARVRAWIADRYHRKTVLPSGPHSKYYNTTCPANLKTAFPAVNKRAQEILTAEGDYV